MEISVTFSEEPTIPETLQVIKKVGSGKFSVYQVYLASHNRHYALKVFPRNSLGTLQFHKEKLMYPLNHPNVIKSSPVQSCDKRVHCLLTELAPHGSFLEVTNSRELDTELIVRSYFHQLVNGLEYIHSQGLAHLDLKLENLMLGSHFQLKIIDFDQSQPLSDFLVTSKGTANYRAPEIRRERCRNLSAADVYSLGVILFAFATQGLPFIESTNKTKLSYEEFTNNNEEFWKVRSKSIKIPTLVSDDFIGLVNAMLHPEPCKRATIQDIKNSEWFKKPVLSQESLESIMKKKKLFRC